MKTFGSDPQYELSKNPYCDISNYTLPLFLGISREGTLLHMFFQHSFNTLTVMLYHEITLYIASKDAFNTLHLPILRLILDTNQFSLT